MCPKGARWPVSNPGCWTIDHSGRLDCIRGRGWESISGSRGSPRLLRVMRIVLDITTSLRMSARAMLNRTGCQPVPVPRSPYYTCDGHHGVIQMYNDEIGVSRRTVHPDWSATVFYSRGGSRFKERGGVQYI